MLVPKLRFKRDDGTEYPEWSKNKWSDLGSFIGSGTLSKSDLTEEGTPCILYGELYTKYREIAHTIYSKTNATSHSFSQADDVILPKSGETPEDISTATCIPYDGISLGGDLIVFRHNEKVTGAYLSYLISNRAKNAIASIAQGKSIVHINEKALSNIELPYPQIEEQQKIADFLSTVDEVIAQSEAEVQNFEQQKKAAMQKIFSQEVRFKREDGTDYPEWEEKPIGMYAKIFDGVHQTPNYIESGVPFVSVEDIETLDKPTKYISVEDYERDFKTKPIKGDILMTRIGDVGRTAIVPCNGYAYYVSLALVKPFNSVNNNFLCQAMRSNFFQQELWEHTIHTAFPKKINAGDIQYCKIRIPADLEEQQKIADFFSAYDEAISYAKQELDKWKELKKGLLQQMFV